MTQQRVTVKELSNLTGCSLATISRFSQTGVIPRPVASDGNGNPIFDLGDRNLAAWVESLQRAGYHRRPGSK